MRTRAVRTMITGAVAVGAVGGAALAAAASAAAHPTVTVSNPQGCFVNTFSGSGANTPQTEHFAMIKVSGTGWTAGDTIALSLDGTTQLTVPASANGTFTASLKAPDPPGPAKLSSPGFGTSAVTATDQGNPNGTTPSGATATSRTVRFTDREVQFWTTTTSQVGSTSDFVYYESVHFRAAGFTPGKGVYAHYLDNGRPDYNSAGKLKSTMLLGTASGPCGVLVTKQLHVSPYPKNRDFYGYFTVWFSSFKPYTLATRQYAFLVDLT